MLIIKHQLSRCQLSHQNKILLKKNGQDIFNQKIQTYTGVNPTKETKTLLKKIYLENSSNDIW